MTTPSGLTLEAGALIAVERGDAVVDHLDPTTKAVFERRVRVVDSQAVMDVNNARRGGSRGGGEVDGAAEALTPVLGLPQPSALTAS
ncbi:MAG: hypothetical protein LC799_12105 [Actinobacteria bacterium]|nr:hypothetical protein [Actinomycetota bacterium]